jgi:hypothetical protein
MILFFPSLIVTAAALTNNSEAKFYAEVLILSSETNFVQKSQPKRILILILRYIILNFNLITISFVLIHQFVLIH